MEKTRNIYIRKFGTEPLFDYNHKPIPAPKFDIGFVIMGKIDMINFLEPWCSTIYTDIDYGQYIKDEHQISQPDILKKIKPLNFPFNNDIIVKINQKTFNNTDFEIIQQFPNILKDSGEVGEFTIGNMLITVNNLTEYQNNLIFISNQNS